MSCLSRILFSGFLSSIGIDPPSTKYIPLYEPLFSTVSKSISRLTIISLDLSLFLSPQISQRGEVEAPFWKNLEQSSHDFISFFKFEMRFVISSRNSGFL